MTLDGRRVPVEALPGVEARAAWERLVAEHAVADQELLAGDPEVLGEAFDRRRVDRVWCLIAPVLGGSAADPPPVGGSGVPVMDQAWHVADPTWEPLDGHLLLRGSVVYAPVEGPRSAP